MKLKAILPFDWAHGGVKVEHFPVGAVIETQDEDLITVSTNEGWAVEAGLAPPPADSAETPETAEEVPADPVPDTEEPDATETPAAPKRGRAKQ